MPSIPSTVLVPNSALYPTYSTGLVTDTGAAIFNLNSVIAGVVNVLITQGVLLSRPAASANSGVLYYATDVKHLDYSDGSVWRTVWTGNVSTITTSTSLTANQIGVVFLDATAGSITVTLPAANVQSGAWILLYRIDSTANTVTIQRAGSDTIDLSSTTVSLGAKLSSLSLIADGVSRWITMGPRGSGLLAVQIITTTGTYTPNARATLIIVELVGGGGGGGGAALTAANQVSVGGGGGSGGYARKLLIGPTSQTVTIGSGGPGSAGVAGTAGTTTSFGSVFSAPGGSGGAAGTSGSSSAATGGAGGAPSTGDINVPGGIGELGWAIFSTGHFSGGYGGGNLYGAPGRGGFNSAGSPGSGFGSGGGGASNPQSFVARAGGAGAPGVCMVNEFG